MVTINYGRASHSVRARCAILHGAQRHPMRVATSACGAASSRTANSTALTLGQLARPAPACPVPRGLAPSAPDRARGRQGEQGLGLAGGEPAVLGALLVHRHIDRHPQQVRARAVDRPQFVRPPAAARCPARRHWPCRRSPAARQARLEIVVALQRNRAVRPKASWIRVRRSADDAGAVVVGRLRHDQHHERLRQALGRRWGTCRSAPA